MNQGFNYKVHLCYQIFQNFGMGIHIYRYLVNKLCLIPTYTFYQSCLHFKINLTMQVQYYTHEYFVKQDEHYQVILQSSRDHGGVINNTTWYLEEITVD